MVLIGGLQAANAEALKQTSPAPSQRHHSIDLPSGKMNSLCSAAWSVDRMFMHVYGPEGNVQMCIPYRRIYSMWEGDN